MKCSECSKEIRQVVAVDIDGTLADYHLHFLRFAREWLGPSCGSLRERRPDGSTSLAEYLGIDKRTYREVKLAFRQSGLKRSMPLRPGASVLMNWLRARKVEIWVTTTRPYLRHDNIDPDTREWLDRNQIPYDHLVYDEDKYAVLVDLVGRERVACVIDDEAENCARAQELGVPAVFLRTSYNAAIRPPVVNATLAYQLPSLVGAGLFLQPLLIDRE